MSATGSPDEPGKSPAGRKLVAVLYADMVGYSRLIGLDDAGTLRRLRAIRASLIDPAIKEHDGRIVHTGGDSLLIVFASIDGAVRCAVNVQRGVPIHDGDQPPDRAMRFRIGINIGDVIPDGTDVHGEVVNVAARLQAVCPPGDVCVSRVVRDHVRDRSGTSFEELGSLSLKNIARPVEAFVLGVATTAGMPRQGGRDALPLPDKPSIAILPFNNMSGDPEQEYFADGIAEEVTTAIARLPWLFVIARNSSFTYKGRAVDAKQIARELGVRYVLEGSVRKAGNRVRITSQLIDTSTNAHIWADRFDGALDDIFELQDMVASGVVGAIEPRLRHAEIERARHKPTASLSAYDLYLQALAHVHKATRESVSAAIELCRSAIEADPTYANAAGLAAWSRLVQRWQGWVRPGGPEDAEGIQLAKLALEFGRDDPDALWMAAHAVAALGADHKTALAALDRALSLNPNSAHAWGAKGLIESYHGNTGVAIECSMNAMRLSPLDLFGYNFKIAMTLAHLGAGRYEDALRWVEQTLQAQPRFHAAYRIRLAIAGLLGRTEETIEWLAQLLELQPGLTVSSWAAHGSTFLSPLMMERMTTGLRQAGLPER
jgi:TolB-like protein/class 3 adenylate cyclase